MMNEELRKLPTPAVVVDLDTVQRNIDRMLADAKEYGIKHRPHIKTHRCTELARMQVEAGCCGITVAKLGEAEVMAAAGIDDIFVAYSVIGEDKLERLVNLAKKCRITTAVNSLVCAKGLSDAFEKNNMAIDVLIEVDGGLNRGGLKPYEATLDFAEKIKGLKGIRIIGLMYYGGFIYDSYNIKEIEEYAKKERDELVKTAGLLINAGYRMEVLSAGSSFSGKVPSALEGITEIRAGHYIFNDCGQLDVGLATPDDCALTVVSTVVCKPDDYTVIADAGTKTLTGDRCHHRPGYGYVIGHPEIEIYSLNEEHAFLRSKAVNPLQIGDKIEIIPNHACVVTNLVDEAYGFRGKRFDHTLKIDARGKSV